MLDYRINEEFARLGKNLYLIGILLLLAFIPLIGGIFSIISFFVTLSALAKIKRIREQLNDDDLYKARKFYIYSYVVLIIGFIIVITILVIIMLIYNNIYLLSLMMVLTYIPLIIASVIEYKAWSYFGSFFEKHPDYFPDNIVEDAKNGCNKITMSIILRFFMYIVFSVILIILFIFFYGSVGILNISATIVNYIGMGIAIYRALGYFKLGHLKYLSGGYMSPPQQQVQYQQPGQYQQPIQEVQPQQPSQTRQAKFCHSCGSKIGGNSKFCTSCGEKLDF